MLSFKPAFSLSSFTVIERLLNSSLLSAIRVVSSAYLRLLKVKEESEKVGLKLNIEKSKIMASGHITSWRIDEETMEAVTDFILGGSKITADCDCSHEIKRHLLLGRKAMTNLDSMLKTETLLYQQRSIQAKLWLFQ